MNDFVGAVIVGIIFLTIYRIFELFVRRDERKLIIEKLGGQIKLSDPNVDLNLPIFQSSNGIWALRMSLLLIGVGIGLIVGYLFEYSAIGGDFSKFQKNWNFQRTITTIYFASVAVFGGIGLLTAYFIEKRNNRKED